MTTKELDYKLAKDIARIRVATGKTSGSTLAEEIVSVITSLNTGEEGRLTKEILDILHSDSALRKLELVMTRQYAESVCVKLKIRHQAKESPKPPRKYNDSDIKQALKTTSDEVEKAVSIIARAIASGANEAIINASVVEAFCFDTGAAKTAIINKLAEDGTAAKEEIGFEVIDFMSLANDAVEYLKKELYYHKWIYERFQPIGIIKVSLIP